MRITRQSRYWAQQLFLNCLTAGRLDEKRVRETVTALVARQPRDCLAVLARFQRLVKLNLDRYAARVESAVPLTAEARAGIAASLSQRYGGNLSMVFSETPGLIGGLRIRVGSDVYDGSVRSRLDKLLAAFSESSGLPGVTGS